MFGDVKKKGQPVGILLKVPAGGRAGAHSHTSDDYVVGITGMTHDFVPGGDEGKALGPGGHWFQPGKMVHDNHCEEKGGTCLSFVYLPKGFDMIPAKADAKPAADREGRRRRSRPLPKPSPPLLRLRRPLRLRPRLRLRRSNSRLDDHTTPWGPHRPPRIFFVVRQ